MTGLVWRDLITYYRKNSKFSYLLEILYLLLFLFVIPGVYGGITYLVLVVPVTMCGLPMVLKEIDTNYKGMMTAMTLPCTRRDIVRARFISAFADHIFYLAEMLIFCILHYMIKGTLSLKMLFLMMLGGWLISIFMTAVNLLASFTSGFSATTILYLIFILLLLGGYLLFMLTGFQDYVLAVIREIRAIWLWVAAILADVLIVFISYIISARRFEKKY